MGDKMKKCVMIYNSKSGKKKSDELLPELEQILNENGYELILKYVKFLGYPKNHLFFGLDVRPEFVMNKIHNL